MVPLHGQFHGGIGGRARLDGRQTPKNHDCVYYLLTWSDGRFEFTSLDVDMDDEVRLNTTSLLMEGARRLDELKRPPGVA